MAAGQHHEKKGIVKILQKKSLCTPGERAEAGGTIKGRGAGHCERGKGASRNFLRSDTRDIFERAEVGMNSCSRKERTRWKSCKESGESPRGKGEA